MAKDLLSGRFQADHLSSAVSPQKDGSSSSQPIGMSDAMPAVGVRKHRQPKYKPEVVIEALRAAGGSKSVAAAKFGASRNTVDAYIRSNRRIRDALNEIEEETLDLAETGLVNALRAERPWAIQFYLRTKGRRRGYLERREIADDDAAIAAQSSRVRRELELQRAVSALAPEEQAALMARLGRTSSNGSSHRRR